MPIQNKDTLAASVPTPPLGSTTLFTDAGLLRTKDDTGTVITLAAGGTVTGVSVTTANGVSGVVATPTTTPAITLTLGAITPTSVAATSFISANGDLTINGLGRRITADFTNATVANRTLIQTSVVNGHTHTGIIPNGTGQTASFNAYDSSDPDNASWISIFSEGSGGGIQSGKNGTGTLHPFYILVGSPSILAITFDTLGNSIFGGIAALATNATDRFPYLPTMAGTPIGTPTTVADKSPVVVDTTNNKLYFYSTGAWRDSAGTGTVSTVSVTTANGVSGSVATASTTPAITLTLGAITPSSVAAVGTVTGSNLSGSNTGDQTITLTGGVTGSGVGSFATTVVTNANLTGDVTSVGNTTTYFATVPSTKGGTAQSTYAVGDTLYASALNTLSKLTVGSAGHVLTVAAGVPTWAAPATNGTVTTVSVTTANGVSGSVATNTTTPAITLTLGAITPSSVSSTGDVSVETAGSGLKIKEGSNAKMGVATLALGTVVVSTTAVTANSRIFLTAQVLGTITVPAALAVSARTAATSFTILSSALTDTSDVAWMIVEPA